MLPKEMKKHLDKYVIKQDHAKKVLSTALYQHLLKYNHHKKETPTLPHNIKIEDIDEHLLDEFETFELSVYPQSNALLIGSTGVGKTYLTSLISEQSNLPNVRVDCSTLSAEGWQGDNLSSYFQKFIEQSSDYNDFTHGILILDEIDKLAIRGQNAHAEHHKKLIQQELLSILDGNDIKIPTSGEKIDGKSNTYIFPTQNLFIIMCGVFDELHADEEKKVGFNSSKSINNHNLISDLKKYGIIPELLGRIVDLVELEDLNEEDLFKILTSAKDNPLELYGSLLKEAQITLKFEEKTLKYIAQESYTHKTGARSLRKIISKIINDNIYEHAGTKKTINITKNMI